MLTKELNIDFKCMLLLREASSRAVQSVLCLSPVGFFSHPLLTHLFLPGKGDIALVFNEYMNMFCQPGLFLPENKGSLFHLYFKERERELLGSIFLF